MLIAGISDRQTNRLPTAASGKKTVPVLSSQSSAISSQHHSLLRLGLHSSIVDSSGGLDLAVSLSRLALELTPAYIRHVSSSEISTDFDVFHYLAMAVYALSNNLIENGRAYEMIGNLLEFIFGRIPYKILTTFLRRDPLSMRAAWEALVEYLIYVPCTARLMKPFRNFMKLGISYNWTNPRRLGHHYLYCAARMGCADIVQALLTKGCRPDTDIVESIILGQSAIVAALLNRDLECIRLLIGHCDVNRRMYLYDGCECTVQTNFTVFIEWFCLDDELHNHALELFMQKDADRVDMRLANCSYYGDGDRFYMENEFPEEWGLSILELCFYRNRFLFKRLRPYSNAKPTQMTRAGVLGALELGLHSLQDYLKGVRPVDPGTIERHLQLILAEQFLTHAKVFHVKEVAMDPHVFLVLLELGVDPTFSLLKNAPNMLSGVIRQRHVAQDNSTKQLWTSLLQLLIEYRASPGPEALEAAVPDCNISLSRYPDIADQGRQALVTAASHEDFDAVDLLLQAGVDINSYVQSDDEHLTILALAVSNLQYDGTSCSCRMMIYLIEKGAKLKALSDDWHPCHFLRCLLRRTMKDFELEQKVQYIVENHIDLGNPCTPSDGLLEACLRSSPSADDWARLKKKSQKKIVATCRIGETANLSIRVTMLVKILESMN